MQGTRGWPPDFVLRGTVEGLGGGKAWVRLLRVASNTLREVEVGIDGSFELYHPEPGQYVLLVLQTGRLLAAQYLTVTLASPPSVEIKIPASVR